MRIKVILLYYYAIKTKIDPSFINLMFVDDLFIFSSGEMTYLTLRSGHCERVIIVLHVLLVHHYTASVQLYSHYVFVM